MSSGCAVYTTQISKQKKAHSHAVGNYSERFEVVLQVRLGNESILLFVIHLYNHTVT